MKPHSLRKAWLHAVRIVRMVSRPFRSPRLGWKWAKAVWAVERSFDFDHTSSLPWLPPQLSRRIRSSEVVMPPLNLLTDGNQSLEGLAFLVGLARVLESSTIFEIGTYNGATAWCLARNIENVAVHTLDIPSDATPELPIADDDWLTMGKQRTRKLYETLNHEGKVIQHWGDSATFDFEPWVNRCDLVYVDGAHSPM